MLILTASHGSEQGVPCLCIDSYKTPFYVFGTFISRIHGPHGLLPFCFVDYHGNDISIALLLLLFS